MRPKSLPTEKGRRFRSARTGSLWTTRSKARSGKSSQLSSRMCPGAVFASGLLLEDLMSSRNVFAGFLIGFVLFTLSFRAAAQGTWAVENTFHVGGDGGMDYITLDAQNHRLYV